jgi:hypothetical protein
MAIIQGLILLGKDWKTAKVAAFYSAKLNSAQQNYPVHKVEMLAGVESMLRHRHILQGIHFKWITDHKGLIYLLNQKDLSGGQARWMEKISEFDFEVVYVPGTENVLADALSRMYSNDAPGTVRSDAEYTQHDDSRVNLLAHGISTPLLAGIEAMAVRTRRGREIVLPSRFRDNSVLPDPDERKEGAGRQRKSEPRAKNTKKQSKPVHTNSENTEKDTMMDPPSIEHMKSGNSTEQAIETDTVDEPKINEPQIEIEGLEDFENPVPNTSLVDVVSGGRDGINLLESIRNKYGEDSFYKNIITHPKEYKNFEVTEDGLVYLKTHGQRCLCIPHIIIDGRNVRELVIAEAHSLLAHLGANKTLDYLRDHVWWRDMVRDTKIYCDTCQTCRRSKPANQKPYGLLNPLPIPAQPWESIGVDFIGPLPESENRDGLFDSITVVIDLLTSMVHLIPSRTDEIAELMFEAVYKLHGLPKNIISDRDVLFTSTFWQHLNKLVGTKLKMSSAYHPQTDGSTERANRTVTQMLRQCVDSKQKDWVSKLPAIEFAINSARSESTGYAPFFLNNGRMPRSMIWEYSGPEEFLGVRNFALQRKLALMQAHDSILAARVKQTKDGNKHRRPSPFKKGDLCYVSTKNITFPKGYARKLVPKYIGPYKILEDFKNESYRIDLPRHLKHRGIHDSFHASLLRIHLPNDDRLFPG